MEPGLALVPAGPDPHLLKRESGLLEQVEEGGDQPGEPGCLLFLADVGQQLDQLLKEERVEFHPVFFQL